MELCSTCSCRADQIRPYPRRRGTCCASIELHSDRANMTSWCRSVKQCQASQAPSLPGRPSGDQREATATDEPQPALICCCAFPRHVRISVAGAAGLPASLQNSDVAPAPPSCLPTIAAVSSLCLPADLHYLVKRTLARDKTSYGVAIGFAPMQIEPYKSIYSESYGVDVERNRRVITLTPVALPQSQPMTAFSTMGRIIFLPAPDS
jgi:hypothetical protein